MTRIIDSFDQVSDNYEVAFVDLWGCLHNGVTAFPAAIAALEKFRDKGGIVFLLTNAPRPKASVKVQLDGLNVPRNLYHEVATSGDAARAALGSGSFGRKVFHIGPERDLPFFEPTEQIPGLADIQRVPLAQAESVVCTGLFDDQTETPEDYAAILLEAHNRGLRMLCANPDIVVDLGHKRIYCAGAIAAAYTERGGDSLYFGKPHPPIYDLARNRLTALMGRVIPDKRIICIGDGINTDISGALGEDLDCLFITGGLAAKETGTDRQPDAAKLAKYLNDAQISATLSIGHLR